MNNQSWLLATIPSRLTDFLALTKPRLNSLVIATTGIGYYLGTVDFLDFQVLFHVVVGSGLVAGGAAAFNQVSERDIDATMQRTKQRPLPSGRLTPREGILFAATISILGLVELAFLTNKLAAMVAAVTLLTYVTIYTPLKRKTRWSTFVGAIPGALPPLIGWAAARGELNVEAWLIFLIVFLWQLPHFYSLSWLYRDDFGNAGLPLLATIDVDGKRTARQALYFSLALVSVSLSPSFVGFTGPRHLVIACLSGILFIALNVIFLQDRTNARARLLFLGSLLYLPVLWISLLIESTY